MCASVTSSPRQTQQQQLSSVKHHVHHVYWEPVGTLLEKALVALFTLLIRCVECCLIKCPTNGVEVGAKHLCPSTLEHCFFLSNLIMWRRMLMMMICTQEKSIISLFVSIILVNNLFSILIYVASLY